MPRSPSTDHFAADTQFRKLLSRNPDIDIVEAALELERDADSQLEFQATHRWIEDRATELQTPAMPALSEREMLEAMSQTLAETHGLGGDAACYESAESSYLSRVIATGRGIPISLSLLYVAVGRKLGLQVYGVGAPSHFLVACETGSKRVFVDPFSHGRILEESQTLEWLADVTGLARHRIQATFRPAGPREIIVRMLNNLKRLHVEQEHWPALLPVQRRIVALSPGSYGNRRDLAVIAQRAGRYAESLNLFNDCLKTCPDEERESLEQFREKARSGLASWN